MIKSSVNEEGVIGLKKYLIMLLISLLIMVNGCSNSSNNEQIGYEGSSINEDIPVPNNAKEIEIITTSSNPNIKIGVRYELDNIGGEQGLYPPKEYFQKLKESGWIELEDQRLGHVQFFEKDDTEIAIEIHEGTFEIYEMNLLNNKIEGLYPGFVHKEVVPLSKGNYEVYYWNSGIFDYTQFAIIKNQQIVFDSAQAGIVLEGGYKFNKEKDQWVEGIEQNNRPTFRFELADNRPESASIVVEEIDNIMQVTVYDNVFVEFIDVDHDGNLELLSAPYSGQMPLGPAIISVYKWDNDQYVSNPAMTRQYWEDNLQQSEETFEAAPTEQSFDSLLSAYLLLDRIDECVKRFPTYYKWAGQTVSDNGYVSMYFNRIQKQSFDQIEGWIDKAKPLLKQKH